MNRKQLVGWTLAAAGAAGILVGCATTPSDAEITARASEVLKRSFNEKGQAKLDRLNQDDMQKTCSAYAGKNPPQAVVERIQKENLATIKWPADGKYLGDWRNGEKIAQEGRGKQYSDDPKGPVGGNCYACHQLTPQEVSYGTIGPSLYQYAKLRGYGPDVQKNAYGKVYNADAYAACSNMPRFGHNAILTEQQIKDVTALLMDPQSPVNK